MHEDCGKDVARDLYGSGYRRRANPGKPETGSRNDSQRIKHGKFEHTTAVWLDFYE